ncbi:hypothetical protein L3X38_041743 [Prunus dulcis]|uniref:Gag-pol polyprotein n=1 Tax=Prunus dulcis TaxID=3755 RepID=A0AAD4UT96_PRUDU|nr:hypothetical protein L3X38_041743 [Prunus dulcis]
MSGDKSVFSSPIPFDGGTVTFRGGHKSQVVGKGNVCIPSLPKFKNVRFVEGLTSNLISGQETIATASMELMMQRKRFATRVSGNICYILRDMEHLSKFDSKSDKGIFIGYSTSSQAYNLYNYRIGTIIWSTNVSTDDFTPSTNMASDEDGLLSPMPEEESPGLDLVVDLSTFSKPVDL